MADVHLRAMANTGEQIRAGLSCANLQPLTRAGEEALRELLPRYRSRPSFSSINTLSNEALDIADRLMARGLSVRWN